MRGFQCWGGGRAVDYLRFHCTYRCLCNNKVLVWLTIYSHPVLIDQIPHMLISLACYDITMEIADNYARISGLTLFMASFFAVEWNSVFHEYMGKHL